MLLLKLCSNFGKTFYDIIFQHPELFVCVVVCDAVNFTSYLFVQRFPHNLFSPKCKKVYYVFILVNVF